jgi:hypothetical protein
MEDIDDQPNAEHAQAQNQQSLKSANEHHALRGMTVG